MRKLIILPLAEIDIKETIAYYKEFSESIDHEFILVINEAFSEIQSYPEAFQRSISLLENT